MQPLSAPKSDLLCLPYLFHLKCNHHPERLSDNLIIPSPLMGEGEGEGGGEKKCIFSYFIFPLPFIPPARGGEGGCRTSSPIYFREAEMQNQRHEVCLNY